MRIRTLAICVVALGLAPGVARGQVKDRAAADALFQAARAEFNGGQFASACEKFAESNRLDPAPGTLLNLSLCYEKIGKVASAWEGFRQVTEQLRDERVDLASERSTALEQRLPWLTLRLPPNAPKGARVYRDGIEIRAAALGVALPIDPGRHELVVEAPGHAKATASLQLAEGQRRDVVVRVGAANPTPEKKPEPVAPHGASAERKPAEKDRTLAWVAGGIGVAGIATSLTTGALALSSRSVVRDHCVDKHCDDDGLQAASSGRTYATISTVSGVVGFVGLGVSTYLFVSDDREQTPSTQLDAAALPGGGYVGMTRSF